MASTDKAKRVPLSRTLARGARDMDTNMTTLAAEHSRDACYYGERGEWLIVLAQHRDSDALTRSNFAVATEALGGEGEHVAIERSSHWAVGWVEYLVVDPSQAELVKQAEEMRERLEDYPVLDEEHFSQAETDEANETWQNCYNERERIAYIRKHRSQFEFQGLADMLGCVRGRYFAGYASELLH